MCLKLYPSHHIIIYNYIKSLRNHSVFNEPFHCEHALKELKSSFHNLHQYTKLTIYLTSIYDSTSSTLVEEIHEFYIQYTL